MEKGEGLLLRTFVFTVQKSFHHFVHTAEREIEVEFQLLIGERTRDFAMIDGSTLAVHHASTFNRVCLERSSRTIERQLTALFCQLTPLLYHCFLTP